MNLIAPKQTIPLLLLMLALAVMFFASFGTSDVGVWLHWMDTLSDNGIINGYKMNDQDYPPYLWLLVYSFTSLAKWAGWLTFIGFKFLLFICLGLSTIFIYHGLNKNIQTTFSFYLALLFSAMCLGYVDICIAPPLLLFCYFIHQKKISLAVFFFTLACLLKFSPLIIAPFIFVHLVMTVLLTPGHSISWKNTRVKKFLSQVILPIGILLLPLFWFFGKAPLTALTVGLTYHSYLSANALNFNWIITRFIQLFLENQSFFEAWRNDVQIINDPPLWAALMAKILFATFYFGSLFSFARRKKNTETFLMFCILGHMSYFMFNVGVHENHLFVACILAIALACINRQYTALAISLCFISSLNMFAFYGFSGSTLSIWPEAYRNSCVPDAKTFCAPPVDFRLLIAICNTLYFVNLWKKIILPKQVPAHV